MIMNIIMLICMYPVIFIIYYFLRNVGNKNAKYVFGVSDVKGLRESETVEEINKVYKKQQKNILLVFMVLPVFCFLTKYMSIQILIWIIWLYAYIIAQERGIFFTFCIHFFAKIIIWLLPLRRHGTKLFRQIKTKRKHAAFALLYVRTPCRRISAYFSFVA